MKIQNYFNAKVTNYHEIKGHFNKNFRVQTTSGTFHLKIFKSKAYEIKKWINGNVIKKWDEVTIKKVCRSLYKLHNSNKSWQPMNYKTNDILDSHYQKLIKKYQKTRFVPCHNDLNQDNIVISKAKAHFIDFEFQRLNNKHWDVANIINEDKLDSSKVKIFLKYYKDLNFRVLEDFIYINKVFNNYWKAKNWNKK